MSTFDSVDAIEMDDDGNYILWQDVSPRRMDGLDLVYSRVGGSITDDTPITKMHDHTVMAQIINGQVWVQFPKQPEIK